MHAVENITNEPHQRHVLLLGSDQINLEIRYMAATQQWIMSIEYNGRTADTLALTAGTPMLSGYLFPFDFAVTVSEGIDPFTLNCFSSGRCTLWFVTKERLGL